MQLSGRYGATAETVIYQTCIFAALEENFLAHNYVT